MEFGGEVVAIGWRGDGRKRGAIRDQCLTWWCTHRKHYVNICWMNGSFTRGSETFGKARFVCSYLFSWSLEGICIGLVKSLVSDTNYLDLNPGFDN